MIRITGMTKDDLEGLGISGMTGMIRDDWDYWDY